MNKIYDCVDFEMYNISLSLLFGESPKIEYICGSCNGCNETRISVQSIELGSPYTQCKICGAINRIPIRIEE